MARRPRTERGGPARPRALWKGTLAFGMVSIPVSLHRAVRPRGVLFHEIHDEDGGRIRHRAVCSVDGAGVSREHIARGFEVERGRMVTVTDAELHALDPAASRNVEIVGFVDPHEVDPLFYQRTYWLVPEGDAGHAYALLAAAMAGLHRAAIARFVLRAREHLAVVRPVTREQGERVLALSTLGYADEILPVPAHAAASPPDERELVLAERLVQALSGHFRPERFHDEHRGRVLDYLRRKAEGELPPAPPESAVLPAAGAGREADLLGALEASVAEAQRHPKAA